MKSADNPFDKHRAQRAEAFYCGSRSTLACEALDVDSRVREIVGCGPKARFAVNLQLGLAVQDQRRLTPICQWQAR